MNTEEAELSSLLFPVFVQVPFTLYHSWSIVLVVVTGFEALSIDAHEHQPDVLTKAVTFMELFFLQSVGAYYAHCNTTDGGLAGSFVIAWTLWGIYDNQKNSTSLGAR